MLSCQPVTMVFINSHSIGSLAVSSFNCCCSDFEKLIRAMVMHVGPSSCMSIPSTRRSSWMGESLSVLGLRLNASERIISLPGMYLMVKL